jgi:hypothetical protein
MPKISNHPAICLLIELKKSFFAIFRKIAQSVLCYSFLFLKNLIKNHGDIKKFLDAVGISRNFFMLGEKDRNEQGPQEEAICRARRRVSPAGREITNSS